ncbi:conserved hypothetical protein [Neospora caninum Liverpool]|uniref:Transcription initiation factor TFIID complex subunit TAF6 n=1 Tax=Neospora caninum (strain Liverpool) TaxID=572307 RepID=F0V7Q6_NEOCL|nr:conserved hypothetical protein [Neospora caninum Liverpool]CBZ49747.1 conserved hypothetical protein [Neospora caninum Liverpool]CEL64331.1 TPA: transcription initiation factor TFIID complex subunit TAF6 [Neospora caninum Liverpool]|eukprot:XP_003879782.1 conserved hypothetical protein [Neospora caninum Liverpool]
MQPPTFPVSSDSVPPSAALSPHPSPEAQREQPNSDFVQRPASLGVSSSLSSALSAVSSSQPAFAPNAMTVSANRPTSSGQGSDGPPVSSTFLPQSRPDVLPSSLDVPLFSSLPTSSLMTSHVLSIARTHGYCSASRGEGAPEKNFGERGRDRGDKLENLLALQETLVSPAAARVIGSMVQFRLVQLIKTAKKLMEHSARVAQEGVLTVGDVHEAMNMLKIPPLLSYSGPSTFRFVVAPRAAGAQEGFQLVRRETLRPFEGPSALSLASPSSSGARSKSLDSTLFSAAASAVTVEGLSSSVSRNSGKEKKPLTLAPGSSACASSRLIDLIYADLKLPAPREEAIGIHWMAVAGSVPAIPQNVLACRERREKKTEDEGSPRSRKWALSLQIYEGERRKRRRGESEKRRDRSQEPEEDAKEKRRKRRESSKRVTFFREDADDSSGQSSEDDSEDRDEKDRLPSAWPLSLERILVAPRLCHALGKEHQQFLQAVRETLQAAMEEKHGVDYERNFRKMLKIVSSIPGLEQLLPCLARFFAVELGGCLHLPHRATLLLRLAEAILANPHLPLHSHVHQFLLPLMECLLRPLPLAASSSSPARVPAEPVASALLPFTPQQLELRRQAAHLLGAFLCRARAHREQMESVETAVLLQLKRHLLHPQSSLETVLGAVWGILALGRPAVLLLLLPVLPLLLHALERVRSLGELQIAASSAGLRMKTRTSAAAQREEDSAPFRASEEPEGEDRSGVFVGSCAVKNQDAALLHQHKSLAALRLLLVDQLLQTLLSCVYEELSLQLTAATTGSAGFLLPGENSAKSLGMSAPALLQLIQVLYDDTRSLSDAYTPFVAAALQRANSSVLSLRVPSPSVSLDTRESGTGAAAREKTLSATSSRQAVRDFVATRVLPSLQQMEASLDARRRHAKTERGAEADRTGQDRETCVREQAEFSDLSSDASYLLPWNI